MINTPRILVTGCGGQIGQVIVPELRRRFGRANVIATDVRPLNMEAPTLTVDVADAEALRACIQHERPTRIYHLAGVLSAMGEADPMRAWRVNLNGFMNILDSAVEFKVERVFFPSTIAVYGPDAPRHATPDTAPTRPTTIYGIAKAAGENLAAWYRKRHGLDVRVLRYPGIIGWESEPGGGTTDYAIEIFHAAALKTTFRCPLAAHRALPMLSMADAIRGTIEFMETPIDKVRQPTGYNLGGFSAAPQDFANAIVRNQANFHIDYVPDHRDAIAASWPESLDDSAARADWGWKPEYDLDTLSNAMLAHCAARVAVNTATRSTRCYAEETDLANTAE